MQFTKTELLRYRLTASPFRCLYLNTYTQTAKNTGSYWLYGTYSPYVFYVRLF
nr:MAG TPA: hypothetical protein [Caudoviricetes sp.]